MVYKTFNILVSSSDVRKYYNILFKNCQLNHFDPVPSAPVRQTLSNLQFMFPLFQNCFILTLKKIGHLVFSTMMLQVVNNLLLTYNAR